MSGPEYDAELEAFLKRRSPMHRRLSDIDHAEPSGELDRLVLNHARKAIETPTEPLFRRSHWALPVGLAAAILIAFTVVLNIDHDHVKVAADAPPAAEAAPQAPAVARATSARPSDSALPASPAPATPSAPATTVSADAHASPDAWLREINRLRAEGRTADADRELTAFRAAYPTHPAYSVAKPPAR